MDALVQKPITTPLFFRMLVGTFGGDARMLAKLRDAAEALVYNEEVEPGAPSFMRAPA